MTNKDEINPNAGEKENAATPPAETINTTTAPTQTTVQVTATETTGQVPTIGAGGAAFLPTTETPENKSGTGGIIALGIYLLLLILFSVYLLAGLMMAETDRSKIDDKLCKSDAKLCPAPSPEASPTLTPTPTPLPPPSPSPAPTPENSNGGANGNSNSATGGSNGKPPNSNGVAANASPSKSPPPPAAASRIEQHFVEVTIPKYVLVDIPLVVFKEISADSYVFLVVVFSGMLGGSIRAVYSFIQHLGLKNFSFNWTWFYISLPFSGAALSLVIYFVIRGGFYGSSFGQGLVLNLFAFAALGALTGLFTDNAMEKLKQVAATLLAETPPKVENAKEIIEQKEANKITK